MTKTNAAPRGDALPDLSGDDEIESEPTKVGDGAVALDEAIRASLATPQERATSKMTPFQLEDVLQKLAEAPPSPERSQARMKAPSLRPTAPAIFDVAVPPAASGEQERVTVPGPALAPLPLAPPPVAPAPSKEGRDIASAVTFVIAVIFVVLTCAVLFGR